MFVRIVALLGLWYWGIHTHDFVLLGHGALSVMWPTFAFTGISSWVRRQHIKSNSLVFGITTFVHLTVLTWPILWSGTWWRIAITSIGWIVLAIAGLSPTCFPFTAILLLLSTYVTGDTALGAHMAVAFSLPILHAWDADDLMPMRDMSWSDLFVPRRPGVFMSQLRFLCHGWWIMPSLAPTWSAAILAVLLWTAVMAMVLIELPLVLVLEPGFTADMPFNVMVYYTSIRFHLPATIQEMCRIRARRAGWIFNSHTPVHHGEYFLPVGQALRRIVRRAEGQGVRGNGNNAADADADAGAEAEAVPPAAAAPQWYAWDADFARRTPVTQAQPQHGDLACAICQESLQGADFVAALPCHTKHVFHVACCNGWFFNHETCPVCRDDGEGHGGGQEQPHAPEVHAHA